MYCTRTIAQLHDSCPITSFRQKEREKEKIYWFSLSCSAVLDICLSLTLVTSSIWDISSGLESIRCTRLPLNEIQVHRPMVADRDWKTRKQWTAMHVLIICSFCISVYHPSHPRLWRWEIRRWKYLRTEKIGVVKRRNKVTTRTAFISVLVQACVDFDVVQMFDTSDKRETKMDASSLVPIGHSVIFDEGHDSIWKLSPSLSRN